MRELFVYYRINAASADAARSAVLAMQRELRAARGNLIARFLVRCDADGDATWMETYALGDDASDVGIDARIEADIAARAASLRPFIDGPRHVEAFHSQESS